MKDGTVGWNPGKLNPNIIKPAGTIDPEVPVVFFESTDGKPLADLRQLRRPPGQRRRAEDLRRPAVHAGPRAGRLQGPGDDHAVLRRLLRRRQSHRRPLARAAARASRTPRAWARSSPPRCCAPGRGWSPSRRTPSASRARSSALALPAISEADVARSRAVIARMEDPKAPRPSFLEMVDAFKTRDVAAREGRPQEVEVQVIALGDEVAWVSLPGEIFVELGLAIKQDSPFRPHDHRRAGQRRDRLHPARGGPTPRGITRSSAPDAPRAPASGWSTPPCGCSRNSTRKRERPGRATERRRAR